MCVCVPYNCGDCLVSCSVVCAENPNRRVRIQNNQAADCKCVCTPVVCVHVVMSCVCHMFTCICVCVCVCVHMLVLLYRG